MTINEMLPKVKEVELEILTAVDKFCQKNNIKYSLAYGTMLGAIRHKGFIPWDDDIDIFMLREDYVRFEKLWLKNGSQEYVLENSKLNSNFTQCHTKIIKDNTTFLQRGEENAKYHKGIFIDVFILDRVADTSFEQKIQKMNAMLYFLYTRGFPYDRGNFVVKFGCQLLLGLVPKKYYQKIANKLEKNLSKYDSHKNNKLICYCAMETLNHYYPSNAMEMLEKVDFESRKFCCSKMYDIMLKSEYGDYMQLPPEEERVWKHHPVLIDFKYNYDKVKEKNNA